MFHIVLVILPIFLLIFLGSLCRWRAFPGDGFWAPAERLTYYLLLPALIVATLADVDLSGLALWPMALAMAAGILIVAGLTLALRPWLGLDGPGFTSLFQSAIRLNGYIGLTAAFGLYGETGLAAAAVAVATYVPLVNVGAVAVLARHGTAAQPGAQPGAVALKVARNPLILACLLGGLVNVTGLGLPPGLGDMLRILGGAALPLGLLAVGAGLDLSAIAAAKRVAALSCALKLLAMPMITAGFALLFGAQGVALGVAVLFAALPVATSSYILARQMGGDAPLLAGLCTLQHLLAMASLPLMLAFFG